MSFRKLKSVDQITILENGIVLFREATRIFENDVELSKNYHRSSLTPGQDLTGVPENVVIICNTVWSPDVISSYEASQSVI
jgi:hypothetical protein